jgi:murein DD-endopeptidase MepM/ murein hydrolase activator NlpD
LSTLPRTLAAAALCASLLVGCGAVEPTSSSSSPRSAVPTAPSATPSPTLTRTPTPIGTVVTPSPSAAPAAVAYPTFVDLDAGQPRTVTRVSNGVTTRTFKLVSVTAVHETNLWFPDKANQHPWLEADVTVQVDGRSVVLRRRPYQMPVVFDGLRLHVENVAAWNATSMFEADPTLTSQVRISFVRSDESWGPGTVRFPIQDYRWRSSPYMNTWSSLVPKQGMVYYHAGEDFGAMPDLLSVVAPMAGTISQTPLPSGDGYANDIGLTTADGTVWWFSHMDTSMINPELTQGAAVGAAEVLGKTGHYWMGGVTPDDPHLHVEIWHDNKPLASYPVLMEAYLRDYPDAILAVAGGYRSTIPGQAVELDATRSLTRDGSPVATYLWLLHDGRKVDTPVIEVSFAKPGLYSEQLTVTSASGAKSVDFVQVQVFDPTSPGAGAFGWAYASPVRGIQPGTPVLFWPRLVNTTGDVVIDFGDGTPPQTVGQEATHAYQRSGLYVVTLSGTAYQTNAPIVVKLPVTVE